MLVNSSNDQIPINLISHQDLDSSLSLSYRVIVFFLILLLGYLFFLKDFFLKASLSHQSFSSTIPSGWNVSTLITIFSFNELTFYTLFTFQVTFSFLRNFLRTSCYFVNSLCHGISYNCISLFWGIYQYKIMICNVIICIC